MKNAEVEAFARKLLAEKLAALTEDQRTFFHRLFPGRVPTERIDTALDLCDRTLQKNEQKAEQGVPR